MAEGPFDPFEAVLRFHRAFGVLVGEKPGLPSAQVADLRRKLMEEELGELEQAMADGELVGIADGLADLLYVVYGTAVSYGIDIRPIFEEVHRTNMAKAGGPTRDDGKVLKPDGWQPPNLQPILNEMRITGSEGA
jgi:predicted HAD superfamily Cof-like phosphohydrolase